VTIAEYVPGVIPLIVVVSTTPLLQTILYGGVPPVIDKLTVPKPLTTTGFVTLQTTPKGNKVITLHSFFTTALVVVVVVYVGVGVKPGVFVGVGVAVRVGVIVGVTVRVGVIVAVTLGVGVGVGHGISDLQKVQF
jgi:hypothetical protein